MEFPRASDVATRIKVTNARGDDEVAKYIAAKREEYLVRITIAIRNRLRECSELKQISVAAEIESTAVKFSSMDSYKSRVKALCTEEIAPLLQEVGWRVVDVDCFAYDDTIFIHGYVVVRVNIDFPHDQP